MLHCRDQADDLIGCIIIIIFEIINSKQEALHHNYELYSVIPQTLLHAGKSPFFRGVEDKQERFKKDAPNMFTEKNLRVSPDMQSTKYTI